MCNISYIRVTLSFSVSLSLSFCLRLSVSVCLSVCLSFSLSFSCLTTNKHVHPSFFSRYSYLHFSHNWIEYTDNQLYLHMCYFSFIPTHVHIWIEWEICPFAQNIPRCANITCVSDLVRWFNLLLRTSLYTWVLFSGFSMSIYFLTFRRKNIMETSQNDLINCLLMTFGHLLWLYAVAV